MKTTVIPAAELSEDLCDCWRSLQAGNPDLTNPFFAPEFTRAVAAVRADAKVAVIEDAGSIRAFFPFHPGRLGFGRPIGEVLSDYHGLVASLDFDMPPQLLLRETGLIAWDFNHAPAIQNVLRTGTILQGSSPIIDLSAGYMAYLEAHQSVKSELMRKYRRLEKEVGPVRFVARSIDTGLLQMCLDLKSRQYLKTGVRNIFAISWVRDLMHSLQEVSARNLTGVLSALFAGDKVVSLHFGMRSASVWHYWFPAYDVAYSRHSPGMLLLLKMAEACSDSSITSIDLGQGNSHYKMRLSNGAHPLLIGSLERPCIRVTSRSMVNLARKAVQKTVVGSILRVAKAGWKNAKVYVNKNNTP